ncbi:MAG TPA: helix-turn-helix domain-containing protein [Methylomirabilota bacterium]|nr:helix-turn-helix domain-containing protein [Methylomirabilota bacterium]
MMRRHSINFLKMFVAQHFGVTPDEICGFKRTDSDIRPRWLAMIFSHEAGHTKSAIGRAFGKDHGTVLYALKWGKIRIEQSPEWAADYQSLSEALKNVPAESFPIVREIAALGLSGGGKDYSARTLQPKQHALLDSAFCLLKTNQALVEEIHSHSIKVKPLDTDYLTRKIGEGLSHLNNIAALSGVSLQDALASFKENQGR